MSMMRKPKDADKTLFSEGPMLLTEYSASVTIVLKEDEGTFFQKRFDKPRRKFFVTYRDKKQLLPIDVIVETTDYKTAKQRAEGWIKSKKLENDVTFVGVS